MIRIVLLAMALFLGLPARADDAEDQAKEARLEARRHDLEARLAERREHKAKLEKERDAARMNANIYVLPRYKLEVEEKQKEIDAVDAQIAELEAQLKEVGD